MKCFSCNSTENLVKNAKNNGYNPSWICRKCNTERARKYGKTKIGKKKVYSAVYKSIAKYPHKQKARLSVFYAIKTGNLIKPEKCRKCGSNSQLFGHHTDYNKPLEVEWVCRNCHNDIHKKLK